MGISSFLGRFILAIVLVTALGSCSGSEDVPETGEVAKKYPVVKLGYINGKVNDASIEYDGLNRRFLYYVPENYDPEAKHPLLFALHGFNMPVEVIISFFKSVQAKADADGTILIYPVATGSVEKQSLAWKTRCTCGSFANTEFPETDEVDDIGFISHLIDIFLGNMNADPNRIYITGASQGGAMTYALSCYLSERLAGVAPFIMQLCPQLIEEFKTARPLPIMIVTGTADPLVPEKGNKGTDLWEVFPVVSIEETIAYWKSRNGISSEPIETALDNPVTEVFKGVETPSHIIKYIWKSEKGNDIVWLKVVNGGHWLPTYADGKPLDASNLDGFDGSYMGNLNSDYLGTVGIYDFLLSHSRKE